MPLGTEDQRGFAGSGISEDMFGKIEPGTRKPLCPRHLPFAQNCCVRLREFDMKIFCDGCPEIFKVVDRPLPEFISRVETQSLLLHKPLHIVRDIGLLLQLLRGLPEERNVFRLSCHYVLRLSKYYGACCS